MNLKTIMQSRIKLLIVIIILTIWGGINQYLAYIDSHKSPIYDNTIIKNIAITILLGWVFFILVQFIKIPVLIKLRWIWLGLSLLLAFITPIIGLKINGAFNFIYIGGFSIYTGYWIILFYILYLTAKKSNHQDFKFSYLIEILVTLAILALLISYFDKRLFFVLMIVICINLYLIGLKKTSIVVTLSIFVSFIVLILNNNYMLYRITGYYTHHGNSHQVQQCLNSIEYGGFLGIGFDRTQRSLENGNLLPESMGHSAFAVVIEHFGVLGGIIMIELFIYIFYFSIRVYQKNKENRDRLLVGLLFIVFFILNAAHILNCLNLYPFSSDLSFFSYGRDNLIFTMIFVGLIWKFYGNR